MTRNTLYSNMYILNHWMIVHLDKGIQGILSTRPLPGGNNIVGHVCYKFTSVTSLSMFMLQVYTCYKFMYITSSSMLQVLSTGGLLYRTNKNALYWFVSAIEMPSIVKYEFGLLFMIQAECVCMNLFLFMVWQDMYGLVCKTY